MIDIDFVEEEYSSLFFPNIPSYVVEEHICNIFSPRLAISAFAGKYFYQALIHFHQEIQDIFSFPIAFSISLLWGGGGGA